jgi:hypothetical protein
MIILLCLQGDCRQEQLIYFANRADMAKSSDSVQNIQQSPNLSGGHAIILRIVTRKDDPGSIYEHVGFKNSVFQGLG